MLSSFLCACWPSVCLLWRNAYLLPIFWLDHLLLSYMSYLYIFEIKPLLVELFVNILSYRLSFFFYFFFLWFPLLCKSLSVWLGPICLFLLLFIFVLGYWPRETLLWFMSETILPMFSSKSFMISCLFFKYFCVWHRGVF